MAGIKEKNEEKYLHIKKDRRLLSCVPDPEFKRRLSDRRGSLNTAGSVLYGSKKAFSQMSRSEETGKRYDASFNVSLYIRKGKQDHYRRIKAKSIDISPSGILLRVGRIASWNIRVGQNVILKFKIPPGMLQEGYESRVKIKSRAVRFADEKKTIVDEDYEYIAFEFEIPLTKYFSKGKWLSQITVSSIFMALIVLIIMLMRVESIIYFKYNILVYFYSILTAAYLLSRYLFGAFYRSMPVDPEFTPAVSIIIPCFNEEEWIQKTVVCCLNQDYPIDKLEVIAVDDHSSDNSVAKIEEIISTLKKECGNYNVEKRLKLIKCAENKGKRHALVKGVEASRHEYVTFVDSDSFLHPTAIRNIVQPFRDPEMGGVTGRTDVENKWTNYITKMQTVRYYVAFRILKAAESIFDAVTCLSGPISCYRKDIVLKNKSSWLNQKFLGHPATFGDDRSMTNFILRNYRTCYQDTAICSTIVPSSFKVFLRQQMRWKRSWLRETLIAARFMWKKEPFQALSFYAGFLVPVLAPFVFILNLIVVPLEYNMFPTVFILGILLMSFLMSFAYLLFKKSTIWIYGLVFCLFYEFILLWQMPVACATFWKSSWGTRKTKEDIKEEQRRKAKKKVVYRGEIIDKFMVREV